MEITEEESRKNGSSKLWESNHYSNYSLKTKLQNMNL